VLSTPEEVADWAVLDPLAPVIYYLRVHHNEDGLNWSLVFNLLYVEFGLLRAEARSLTLTQLGKLFLLLYRIKSWGEPGRQAALIEARDLRGQLAAIPDPDAAGVRAFTKALGSPLFAEPGPRPEDEYAPTPTDRQILDTLRDVGHRLMTGELLAEMASCELKPSRSTVTKRLALMVKSGRLTKDPKARPRGYGLPGW
jgi:hypothetical protein